MRLSVHADHGHRVHFPSPRVHLGRRSLSELLSVAALGTLLVRLVVAVTTLALLHAHPPGGLSHGVPSLPDAEAAVAAAAIPLFADTRLLPGPVVPAALLLVGLIVDHFTVLLRLGERVAGQASLHLSGHFPHHRLSSPPQDYQSTPRPEFALSVEEMLRVFTASVAPSIDTASV